MLEQGFSIGPRQVRQSSRHDARNVLELALLVVVVAVGRQIGDTAPDMSLCRRRQAYGRPCGGGVVGMAVHVVHDMQGPQMFGRLCTECELVLRGMVQDAQHDGSSSKRMCGSISTMTIMLRPGCTQVIHRGPVQRD